MYDINPLGPLLHLRQLEQQASPKLRQLRPSRQNVSITDLGLAIAAYLRGLTSQLRYPTIQSAWTRR